MIYHCCNENRKSAVLVSTKLNGIDFLEVLDHDAVALQSPRQRTLLVHFLKTVPPIDINEVLLQGGESVTDIGIDWVAAANAVTAAQANPAERAYFNALPDAANVLVIRTDKAGDFSPYRLSLVVDAANAKVDPMPILDVLPGMDPQLTGVHFSFKVECGPDFDCKPSAPDCAPSSLAAPSINYLAKDYGSFRTVILDRLNQLLPDWGAATEADPGYVLAEAVARVGDLLSYMQDAYTTEAYLDTARKRVSLRRHALLVDYRVHDGCNARTWIQVWVKDDTKDAVLLDRTTTRFSTWAPRLPSNIGPGSKNEQALLLSGVRVFEPMFDALLYAEHNEMTFYTWGDANCCLPLGATEATLRGSYPNLKEGDVLIFEEVIGPQTGVAADADIRHRCAVRITKLAALEDWLFDEQTGKPIIDSTQAPTRVTEIQWSAADALPFPVCISSTFLQSDGQKCILSDVSVVRGNVVLADHGITIEGLPIGCVPKQETYFPADPAVSHCNPTSKQPLPIRFQPRIPVGPVTQAVPIETVALPGTGNPAPGGLISLATQGGSVTFEDANGFRCLTLHATDPSSWPACFGFVLKPSTADPDLYDFSVVYNPPESMAQITVESVTGISLLQGNPNLVTGRVNGHCRIVSIPASYHSLTAAPATFSTAPTMLSAIDPVNLLDASGNVVLTVVPTDPTTWPAWFGVEAVADPQNAANFGIRVDYNPGTGLGVNVPVTLENFENLALGNAAAQINPFSKLIQVDSFCQSASQGASAFDLTNCDPAAAVPSITLIGTLDGVSTTWSAQQDLLESGESDPFFVLEVESDQTATARFGRWQGRAPDRGTSFTSNQRVGNGTAGNVGADTIIVMSAADVRIQGCRNPLAAAGGIDPENMEQIRRRAPQAYLKQERAVTMADYEAWADATPDVDRAVAHPRWTGSWYTVFVAVEPKGGGDPGVKLRKSIRQNLERYRLAGQDLEISTPDYLSLDLELEVCVDPAYFQAAVRTILLQVLGSGVLPDGRKGLCYPDNFIFGQTVYLSTIYQAARTVPGVKTVVATRFQPQGVSDPSFLLAGEIGVGPLQVARLENNPSHPNHGQLTLHLEGGL